MLLTRGEEEGGRGPYPVWDGGLFAPGEGGGGGEGPRDEAGRRGEDRDWRVQRGTPHILGSHCPPPNSKHYIDYYSLTMNIIYIFISADNQKKNMGLVKTNQKTNEI